VNKKHRRTLAGLFATPTRTDIAWDDVLSLLDALDATVERGAEGSRVRVTLGGVSAVFHRPHPQPELRLYAVKDVRDFLKQAGVTP
jgi:hypothetical protein